MPNYYGHPSRFETANKRISKFGILAYLVILAAIAAVLPWIMTTGVYSTTSKYLLLGFLTGALLFIDSQIRHEKSILLRFHSGLIGESQIGIILSQLSHQYYIFQDVHIPGHKENIDYVVVGPTGIHAIEVKNDKRLGKIGFNGDELTAYGKPLRSDYIRQTMREATSLNNYLIQIGLKDVFINPILVFSHRTAKVTFGILPKKKVHVIGYKWLIKMITTEPKTYVDPRVIEVLKNTY